MLSHCSMNFPKSEAACYKIKQSYHPECLKTSNNRPSHMIYRGAHGMLVHASLFTKTAKQGASLTSPTTVAGVPMVTAPLKHIL